MADVQLYIPNPVLDARLRPQWCPSESLQLHPRPCHEPWSRPQWFPDRYLPHCVERLIALEAGTLVLTDVGEWWDTPGAFDRPIAAPQDCDARVGTLLKTGDEPGLIVDFGAARRSAMMLGLDPRQRLQSGCSCSQGAHDPATHAAQ